MLSLTKNFFQSNDGGISKAITRRGEIDTDETDFGVAIGTGAGIRTFADKLSVAGLTFEQMQSMYEVNVWVRACIDATVDRASQIPPLIKPVRFEIDAKGKFPDDLKRSIDRAAELLTRPNQVQESFTDIMKQNIRDILKFDAAAFELAKNTQHPAGVEIYVLPGHTVKINKNKKGLFESEQKAYIQVDSESFKEVASWPIGKLCYIMQNPQSDKIYGLSPLETLVMTVTAELFSEKFNLDFFTNQATPRFAVLAEGLGIGQSDEAITRFRKWWMQELRGKYHMPIILTVEGEGKMKFEKVGLTNEEMQFQQYSKWLLQKMMAIYKMQPLILGLIDENMGKLNSEEQTRLFKANALKPLLGTYSEKLNYSVVFGADGLNTNDIYIDFDLDLKDKEAQAKVHMMYLTTGVLTINEIRIKGLGLPPVPWGNVPYLQNNLVAFGQSADGESSALPIPEQALLQAPDDTTQLPSAIVMRQLQGEYLSKQNWSQSTMFRGHAPIGWEQRSESERYGILEKVIEMKRAELSKKYFYQD